MIPSLAPNSPGNSPSFAGGKVVFLKVKGQKGKGPKSMSGKGPKSVSKGPKSMGGKVKSPGKSMDGKLPHSLPAPASASPVSDGGKAHSHDGKGALPPPAAPHPPGGPPAPHAPPAGKS